MRESMVFYRSFYEAIQDLSQEEQLKAYNAILNYALNGIEYTEPGAVRSIVKIAKPQIDANNKRYENGKKGGAPKGNSNALKQPKTTKNNQKQPMVELQNNQKQPNVNVNDNVNDNVNVNVNDIKEKITPISPLKEKKQRFGDFVTLTNAEYTALISRLGETDTKKAIDILDNYKGASGKRYKSDYRAILSWVVDKLKEKRFASRGIVDDTARFVSRYENEEKKAGVIYGT